MFGLFLLAVSMFTISDRSNFWDNTQIALQTQYAQVDEQGITTLLNDTQIQQFWSDLTGKNVLVLVHGYNTIDAFCMYHNIKANLDNEPLTVPYDYTETT